MHDAFNEIIDRLIASGMEEYDAIALVTMMMEEEAREFVFWDRCSFRGLWDRPLVPGCCATQK